MDSACEEVENKYHDKIQEIVNGQRHDRREGIFFFYDDGSTTQVYQGEETYINISRSEQRRIFSQGDVQGSVHSHPGGFNPSTIDLMTGVATKQNLLCVAVPVVFEDGREEYTLSCIDMRELNRLQKLMLFRSMRRATIGVTNLGRRIRKQFHMDRTGVKGCRNYKVVTEGWEYPLFDRPSRISIDLGKELGIIESEKGRID